MNEINLLTDQPEMVCQLLCVTVTSGSALTHHKYPRKEKKDCFRLLTKIQSYKREDFVLERGKKKSEIQILP